MSGPPTDIEASALWVTINTLPRPHKIVDFPRLFPDTDKPIGKLAIWPLTQEEQMICNAEADRFTKQIMKESQKKDEQNLGYEHTFVNDSAIQVLFRACRNHEDVKKTAFPSTKEMRSKLTADEVGALFRMYMTVQLELGPISTRMSEPEMRAWIERLKEGGSAFPFDLLSWELQRMLLTFMASELVSFWTDTSSVGSPPESTPSDDDVLNTPDELEPIDAPE